MFNSRNDLRLDEPQNTIAYCQHIRGEFKRYAAHPKLLQSVEEITGLTAGLLDMSGMPMAVNHIERRQESPHLAEPMRCHAAFSRL